MTPEQIEQERAAFEAWWCETIGVKERLRERFIKSSSPCLEMFKDTAEGMIWEAWLARAAQSEWISVEDRLPETETTVLICTERGDIFSSWASNEDVFWFYGEEEDNRITHWQPLPKPPAGDPA